MLLGVYRKKSYYRPRVILLWVGIVLEVQGRVPELCERGCTGNTGNIGKGWVISQDCRSFTGQ